VVAHFSGPFLLYKKLTNELGSQLAEVEGTLSEFPEIHSHQRFVHDHGHDSILAVYVYRLYTYTYAGCIRIRSGCIRIRM